MKKLLFTTILLFCSFIAFSQTNVIEVSNTSSIPLEVTFAGSQSGCQIDMTSTIVINPGQILTLDAATMNWSYGAFDPGNPNPVTWHTVRAFETCSGNMDGYINYLGYCNTLQPTQTINMVNLNCSIPPIVGDFYQYPGTNLHIGYHH